MCSIWTWINYTLYYKQDSAYNTNMGQLLRTVINFIRHFYYNVFHSNLTMVNKQNGSLYFSYTSPLS